MAEQCRKTSKGGKISQKNSRISSHHQSTRQEKSVKSRNTPSGGNTLSSARQFQKDPKHGTQIMTAQRTQIQSLKRENRKLKEQIDTTSSMVKTISRDCSEIKRKQQQQTKGPKLNQTGDDPKKLTTDI
jgi:predicted phage gp36 major capsid-like protein